MQKESSFKNIIGTALGLLTSLLTIYWLNIPFLPTVSQQCSTQVVSTLGVTGFMLFGAFAGYKLSTKISFIQPPFLRHVAQSSTEATRLRKKEVGFL